MPTKPARGSTPTDYGTKVVFARTITRSPLELYKHLRDLSRLILVVKHPPKTIVEKGDAFEIISADGEHKISGRFINEKPGSLIAWASSTDSDFVHAGSVRFDPAPGDEGTEVTVTIEYKGGGSSKLSEQALGGPGKIVADTLRRFKAFVETGEIPTIDGQSVGAPQKSKKKT